MVGAVQAGPRRTCGSWLASDEALKNTANYTGLSLIHI